MMLEIVRLSQSLRIFIRRPFSVIFVSLTVLFGFEREMYSVSQKK